MQIVYSDIWEWDDHKNRENLLKHGIAFEEAISIFDRPIFTAEDLRAVYSERRFVSIGSLDQRVVLVVVHTPRSNRTRIIWLERLKEGRGANIMSISKRRLRKVRGIKDKEIDTSEIPELDENFWRRAKIVLPEPKSSISLRVDSDVLRWFRAQGKGYQSLMNAVLKSYMESMLR